MKDPRPDDIFRAGQVLNNTYEIRGVLGRGGTGEVYLARNQISGRELAIKALNARFSGQHEYIELMKREEQMRNIINDAVVRYSECSRSDDGHVFLVMDFVDGPSLNDIMFERQMDTRELLIVAHRVLEGLCEVQKQGIVHRDLSPDNIILRGGEPEKATLIDFGIAKDTAAGARTIVGDRFAGKYEYAAPEQLDGKADYRTDLYALGASLLAAWRRAIPDVGTNPAEVVRSKMEPLDTSGLASPLSDLIGALTAPDPDKRPQDAAAALDLLNGWLKPFTTAEKRAAARRGKGRAAIWAGLIVGAMTLTGFALWVTGTIQALFPAPLPHAAPYTIAASFHTDGPTLLTGHAPDDTAAAALRIAFQQSTGQRAQDNALTVSTGLPFDGWSEDVGQLFAIAGLLEGWDLAVTDRRAELTGTAPDSDAVQMAERAIAAWQKQSPIQLQTRIDTGAATLPTSDLTMLLEQLATCGALSLAGDRSGYERGEPVIVTGDVASDADARAIATALTPHLDGRPLRIDVTTLNDDLCRIRAALPPVPPGPVSIWLSKGATGQPTLTGVFHTGENPVAEIRLPEELQGHLWVMVVDNTGAVFHILPNANRQETNLSRLGEAQNGLRRITVLWPMASLQDDRTRLAVQVTEGEYGKSEIIALVTDEPIFDTRRPRDESVSSVALALREALTGRADAVTGIASRIIDARP